ncbi:MAG: ATP-binding cassette domain-containing protein [Bacteroidales bacterium]|nr:ATP-binding cassette domain-containing protein [Bacteroidales bacterium]
MSEEILKALIQMWSIIANLDGGIDDKELQYVQGFLTQQLGAEGAKEHILGFKKDVGLIKDDDDEAAKKRKKIDFSGLTPVQMSVKVLGIARKITKTINLKQRIIVYVRLFELVNTSKRFSEQRMAIIGTVGEVFNINPDELKYSKAFVVSEKEEGLDIPSILFITGKDATPTNAKYITCEGLLSDIYILRIASEELYFLRYTGTDDVYLNGQAINSGRIYSFAPGSTLKMSKGKPVYYSDVVATFQADKTFSNLSFNVNNLEYRFPSGGIGLRNINFSECQGRLVGIMGASGAGKTTLLNVLSGITSPSEGSVKINGINLHTEKEKLEGVIGLIPQDDLLIEELTVYENLYFSAKFCFKNETDEQIRQRVDNVLKSLGLYERKDLKVGNSLNKLISGGQRKRLNIALELIREPSILFVDEPTSGLSSRDSVNVMDLLSELTLKGKLIFVVIHQPSSEIYKMFDKMIILDTGGYLVYYGHPVDAISYFKGHDGQINADEGECPKCGNVNPEIIFDVIEARVVDEYGKFQDNRKVNPEEWEDRFHKGVTPEVITDVESEPPRNLNVPGWFTQLAIYLKRDFKSKISNLQYVFLNLTEAPLLGFILSFLIRYTAPGKPDYIFYENENIVPYIFMSIIVALFLGLTVSAEEIFRDRKILKREEFLNLSRSSYLIAKIIILTCISAIQAFLYVIVGNSILQIWGMNFNYWLVLFAMFVFANMMGLNISSAFNSAVTIYILIPLLMIPQMALGGSMFSFDKLNQIIGSVGKVPIVAEVMASRWSYEALMVKQFKDNNFEKDYYESEKQKNYANFKQVSYIGALNDALTYAVDCRDSIMEEDPEYDIDRLKNEMDYGLALLREEIPIEIIRVKEMQSKKDYPKEMSYNEITLDCIDDLTVDKFDDDIADEVDEYLRKLDQFYGKLFNLAEEDIEARKRYYEEQKPGYYINRRNKYFNEKLQDIVKNVFEKNKIIRYENKLIQQVDPVFLDSDNSSWFGFRSHFYAPNKFFMGKYYDTFYFNIIVIWLMSLLLYITLYFDVLKRVIDWASNINISKLPIVKSIIQKREQKQLEKLAKAEEALKLEKTNDKTEKVRGERPDRAERASRLERPDRAERLSKLERPEREKLERPDRAERLSKLERPEREKLERPDRAERLSKLERPEREKLERPDKTERPINEQTENKEEKTEQTEQTNNTNKEQLEKTEDKGNMDNKNLNSESNESQEHNSENEKGNTNN